MTDRLASERAQPPLPADVREAVQKLSALLEKSEGTWPKLPWKIVPSDGKPIIAGTTNGGNLFRGYIATWDEAELAVAAVNALPSLLAALTRAPSPADTDAEALEATNEDSLLDMVSKRIDRALTGLPTAVVGHLRIAKELLDAARPTTPSPAPAAVSEADVARVARAIAADDGEDFDDWSWLYRNRARAAIGALQPSAGHGDAQPAIPAGMVLVPREPTEAMVRAGWNEIDWDRSDQYQRHPEDKAYMDGSGDAVGTTPAQDVRDAWSAMLAASPATLESDGGGA